MEDLNTKSKIYLSWENVEELVDILTLTIKNTIEIDSVMGLPRGGLIPAVMLSHKLDLPLVFEPTKNTLIVDDICDSGKTFIEIDSKYPNLKFACLHYKMHTSNFMPTVWADIHEGDEFISYPWEMENATPLADYLKNS